MKISNQAWQTVVNNIEDCLACAEGINNSDDCDEFLFINAIEVCDD